MKCRIVMSLFALSFAPAVSFGQTPFPAKPVASVTIGFGAVSVTIVPTARFGCSSSDDISRQYGITHVTKLPSPVELPSGNQGCLFSGYHAESGTYRLFATEFGKSPALTVWASGPVSGSPTSLTLSQPSLANPRFPKTVPVTITYNE